MGETLRMPEPEPSGFVKTLNNMGYMTSTLDAYSRAFVDFAPKAPGPAFEIGTAYGVAALKALEAGAKVVANDLDARHLHILFERAPQSLRGRLKLLSGSFPDEIQMKPQAAGAVLIVRVLHFLDSAAIERGARKIYEWLKPGGKVFAVAETPYLRNFQAFVPVYEERKRSGDPWPGLVEDVAAFSPERGENLPKRMMFLDEEVLSRVFSQAGFVVERAEKFARPEFPPDIRFDGRESVGLIAQKD